jgi:hypothetical protein
MRRLSWVHGLAVAGWMVGPAAAVAAFSCGGSGSGGTGGTGGGTGGTSTTSTTGTTTTTTSSTGGGDAGDGGMPGLTCNKLLNCDQACSSSACTDGCYAQATGVAQGLFDALNDCISANCSSADGGPCADPSSSSCSSCDTSAATGPCISDLLACTSDTHMGPADPDGGGVVVPPMDAGMQLSCGEYTSCVAACSGDAGACTMMCTSQATAEAVALAQALNDCLATACPSGDGGPCQMQGTGCNGCVEQAEFGGPCSDPYNTCENDTSNSPDAGTTPTILNGGMLSTILTGVDQVGSSMIVRDGYLYFSEEGSANQIGRIPVGGGALVPIGAPQPTPVGLAVDSNNVYVWNYGTFSGMSQLNNDDGTAVQVPINGGPQITLATGIQVFYAAPYLNAIAVDQNNVYFIDGASGNNGVILRTAIGGANPMTLFTGQFFPEAIVTDGVNVYWANWGTFDAMGNSNNDGTIMQGSINGGSPKVLASNLSAPSVMTVDANNVYWTNLGRMGANNLPAPNSGSVMQVPIGGGPVVTLAGQQSIPVAIAVSNGTVYWTEYGLGSPGLILSAPIGGGTVVPLVANLKNPYSMALSPATSTLFFSYYSAAMPSSPQNVLLASLSPY